MRTCPHCGLETDSRPGDGACGVYFGRTPRGERPNHCPLWVDAEDPRTLEDWTEALLGGAATSAMGRVLDYLESRGRTYLWHPDPPNRSAISVDGGDIEYPEKLIERILEERRRELWPPDQQTTTLLDLAQKIEELGRAHPCWSQACEVVRCCTGYLRAMHRISEFNQRETRGG